MEATAYLKNIHISPKKLRMVVDDVRTLDPHESLAFLYYSPKKGARILYKAVKSAIDNAKYTLKVNEDLLQFKLLTVEQGNALKRYRPGGRGTAKPFKKRYSHLKIILIAKTGKKLTAQEAQKEKVSPTKPKAASKEKVELKIDSGKKRVKKVAPRKESETKK